MKQTTIRDYLQNKYKQELLQEQRYTVLGPLLQESETYNVLNAKVKLKLPTDEKGHAFNKDQVTNLIHKINNNSNAIKKLLIKSYNEQRKYNERVGYNQDKYLRSIYPYILYIYSDGRALLVFTTDTNPRILANFDLAIKLQPNTMSPQGDAFLIPMED